MATIFTARNIIGNDKSTPLFNLRGLPNQAPTTISNLNIQGIPLERQLAYSQYTSNISAFIYACIAKRAVTVSPRPYGAVTHAQSLPLNPPTVSFTLLKALDSDRSDKLINNLGPGASKTLSGKTTIYHAPGLIPTQLEAVIAVSTPFFNAGRDAVNPRGMRSYMFISTMISTFLRVHSYPAFRKEDPESLTLFDQLVGGTLGGSYHAAEVKEKDKDGKEVARTKDLSEYAYSLNENGKRPADTGMEVDSTEDEAKTSSGYLRSSGRETVVRARPVTKIQQNIGSVSSIPRTPGLLFPYFHGLIQPDAVYMNSMILRRFYQLMGSTHEECQGQYINLRHGINSLASTARGMELCHMLLGIDLALDTQSRCYVIIEKNKYLGFALLGARYAIFSNTKWYAPATEEAFLGAISRMDPHESAVSDLIDKFEKLQGLDQYSGQTNRAIFAEPETFVSELEKLKISEIESDDIRDLDRLVRNLNYMGTGYLSQNPQVIAEMLKTLSTSKDIALARPTHIPSITAPFSDRSFRALAQFGPEAPSFWNDRGEDISCKAVDKSVPSTGGKRKIGEPDVFGNMPIRILITPKPLLIATRDMNRVIETGKVKMDVKERAGKYRNISLEHEDTRKSIWKGLVDLCATKTVKKQKMIEAEDTEAGGVSVDEALLSLLG